MLTLVILLGRDMLIGLTMFQEMINNARQFMRGGDNGLGTAQTGSHPPIECAQGARAATERLRRQPQGLRRPIVHVERAASDHLAARNVVVGRQSQPRAKMFFGAPLPHIRSRFSHHQLHGALIQSRHLCQVHTGQAVQMSTHITGGRVLAMRVDFAIGWQRGQRIVEPRREHTRTGLQSAGHRRGVAG